MSWTELDTWIALTAALLGMACAIPGVFLLLSRQSMFAHGIAHAILPGVVIAFLITSSRGLPAVLVGAIAAAILTALLTRLVRDAGGIEEGASLGVVFTSLFALGIVLIRLAADTVHLDPDVLLFGILETAVMEGNWATGQIPGVTMRSAFLLVANAALCLLFLKELRSATFDPQHAASLGGRPGAISYGIMICTAITGVVAFEAVGSILVVAMMIGPAAIAILLARNLPQMLGLALFAGATSTVAGVVFSLTVPAALFNFFLKDNPIGAVNAAGSISVVIGIFFSLVWATHVLVRRSQRNSAGFANPSKLPESADPLPDAFPSCAVDKKPATPHGRP